MKRAIYVDYENVNISGLKGIEELNHEDVVKIFIGAQTSKLTMVDANRIFNCEASVELITNKYIGKNALDFIIMVHMGYDIALGLAKSYYIISKDKGYDPAIHEMRKMSGLTVARREDITAVLDEKQSIGKMIKGLLGIGKVKESPDTTEHTVVGKGRKDSDEFSKITKDYVKEDAPKSGKRSGKNAQSRKTKGKETMEFKEKDSKAKDYQAKKSAVKEVQAKESKTKDYRAKESAAKDPAEKDVRGKDFKEKAVRTKDTVKNTDKGADKQNRQPKAQTDVRPEKQTDSQPESGSGKQNERQSERYSGRNNGKASGRPAVRQPGVLFDNSMNGQGDKRSDAVSATIQKTADDAVVEKPKDNTEAKVTGNGQQKNNTSETKDITKENLPAVRKSYSLAEQRPETAFTAKKSNENSGDTDKPSGGKKGTHRTKSAGSKNADGGQSVNVSKDSDAGQSVNVSKGIDAGEPVNSSKGIDAGEPVNSSKGIDAGEPVNSSKGIDAGKAANSSKKIDADEAVNNKKNTEESKSAGNGSNTAEGRSGNDSRNITESRNGNNAGRVDESRPVKEGKNAVESRFADDREVNDDSFVNDSKETSESRPVNSSKNARRNRNSSKGKQHRSNDRAAREIIPAAETAQEFLTEPMETEATALTEDTLSDIKAEGGRKNSGKPKNYKGKNYKTSAGSKRKQDTALSGEIGANPEQAAQEGKQAFRHESVSEKGSGQNSQSESGSVNHSSPDSKAAAEETELERQRREAFALLAELEEEEKQEVKFVYKKRR